MDGARLIDVDASNQLVLVARRQSGFGGTHVLTKVWLLVSVTNSSFLGILIVETNILFLFVNEHFSDKLNGSV